MSKLFSVLRAMNTYAPRETPAEPVAIYRPCALPDCHTQARFTCVCCGRMVCAFDIVGADGVGLCIDCTFECVGGIACRVVMQ